MMNTHSMVVMPFFLIFIVIFLSSGNPISSCIEREREALLSFKSSLEYPSNKLSTWIGQDCCSWAGVGCNNITGHVTKLDLRNSKGGDEGYYGSLDWKGSCLVGSEVISSLTELNHLEYLDLSFNNFSQTKIPKFIGNFRKLRYLNLSSANFAGAFPYSLANISTLTHLDLHGLNSRVDSLPWVSHLSNLQYLDLSSVDLSHASFAFQALNFLPSLSELILENCGLQNVFFPSLFSYHNNLTSLSVLNLRGNSLRGRIPSVIFNFTRLHTLNLSYNSIEGRIPVDICSMTNMRFLDLEHNQLSGQIPSCLGEMQLFQESSLSFNKLSGEWQSLTYIDLSYNLLNGPIPASFCLLLALEELYLSSNRLSGPIPTCAPGGWPNLTSIDLSENQLSGPLPSSLALSSNLTYISLSNNQFNGSIPLFLGTLSNLANFQLQKNSFTGIVSESHFQGLSKLQILGIGYNFLVLNLSSNWIPPFQLFKIQLSSCVVGPKFPLWLQMQKELDNLLMSNASIFGNMPKNIGDMMPNLRYLDLSDNNITGRIPISLFEINTIRMIDLSNNHFSDVIPRICWSKMLNLQRLALSNNNFSGVIPNSKIDVCSLESLQLNDNIFHGELPFSLVNCKSLRILDIGNNNFSGIVLSWIGELSKLEILRLRSNRFEGILIAELCNLTSLRILDLSQNMFSGLIPRCFDRFNKMKIDGKNEGLPYSSILSGLTEVMKGKELEYTNSLKWLVNIDLSSNFLEGEIPNELTSLGRLCGLHLSNNQLRGEIPKNIGSLKSLESLDFSRNHLSGMIPQSLSSLTSLSYLNLSYNNLSGLIPTGNQLDTFDPSMFQGNQKLCGIQIQKTCRGDEPAGASNNINGRVDKVEWFYIGMMPGFVVGFWFVCGILFFKKNWRYTYFRFVENMHDRVVVTFSVRLSWIRKMVRDVTH